jgi:hypothetical protein
MAFRIVDALMALIFLAAVAVQYNDPDPIRWMAIYGAACLLSVITVVQRRVHPAVPLLVSAVALVWSAAIMLGGPGGASYLHMLLIVAAWMAVLAVRGKRATRSTRSAG